MRFYLDTTIARDWDRAELHRILDWLMDLREQTAIGRISDSVEKTSNADLAMILAEAIATGAAGWAYNHEIGRILAGYGIECSLQDNEKLGERAILFADNPQHVRVLIAAIAARSPIPLFLKMDLIEALRALDFGEVLPILAPLNNGDHGSVYTLANMRLTAV